MEGYTVYDEDAGGWTHRYGTLDEEYKVLRSRGIEFVYDSYSIRDSFFEWGRSVLKDDMERRRQGRVFRITPKDSK